VLKHLLVEELLLLFMCEGERQEWHNSHRWIRTRKKKEKAVKNGAQITEEDLSFIRKELLRRAAQGFEQCGNWRDAAECWADLQELSQASILYERSGDLEQAARIALEAQDYTQALALYQQWQATLSEGNILAQIRALLGQAACHYLGAAAYRYQATPSPILSLVAGQQAYRQARTLLATIPAIDSTLSTAQAWSALGDYGGILNRYDLVQEGYEHALEVLEERKQQEEYTRICNAYLSVTRAHRDKLLSQVLEERLEQAALPASEQETILPSVQMAGTKLYTFQNDQYGFKALVWSPDSCSLAAGGFDGMHIWNATTGQQIVVASYVAGAACSMAWSPDGKQIVAGYANITIVDTTTFQRILRYRGGGMNAVAWSPDGKRIASSGYSSQVAQIWNTISEKSLLTYRKHSDGVEAIAWSPDSRFVASGSHDHTVQVWDATSGETLYTYRGHSSFVQAVAWSPDGKRIASGSWDNTVQVWDAFTGYNSYTYCGHSNYVNGLSWSPNGQHIASGGYDKTVQIWNATTGQIIFTYTGHTKRVDVVIWSPDGTRIASLCDKTIHVWQAPQ
jgi:dipeptidyl aminopeptidase/acylaminoacyl peptidase